MQSLSIAGLTIDIGEMPIRLHTDSAEFAFMLNDRYGEFATTGVSQAEMELEIELVAEPGYGTRDTGYGIWDKGQGIRDTGHGERGAGLRTSDPGHRTSDSDDQDEDLSVRVEAGRWIIERGNMRAEWDPESHRGRVRQTVNPYAIDGVLRILHSLYLARQGGFLVHASSAVRNGRAFVFAGVSGAGKTTLARVAPPDVTLLTDEISYVRAEEQVSGVRCQVSGGGSHETRDTGYGIRETGDAAGVAATGIQGEKEVQQPPITHHPSPITNPKSLTPDTWHLTPSFSAFGTPFAGEMARIGQKIRAPLAGLFLLKQGPENRIEPLSDGQAVRELMRHVLFFAREEELVGMIFQTVCDFVSRVPVRRLVFTPDARVWELIA